MSITEIVFYIVATAIMIVSFIAHRADMKRMKEHQQKTLDMWDKIHEDRKREWNEKSKA